MLSKMWEEQCWAFRRSPNPKKISKKGAGDFLFWLGVASLFRVPFLEHFFYSFGTTFGGRFRDFFKLIFALGRRLVEAAFLKELPCKMRVFWGRGVQETIRKGVPKGVQKWTPKNTRKSHFLGVGVGTFFGLLGLPWGTLLLSCGLLAPGAQKGRPKSSLREAKSCPRAAQERPREAQGRPRGSQKCPRRARERPKRAPERPREAQDRP